MPRTSSLRTLPAVCAFLFTLIALVAVKNYNYLLFHSLVEIFSAVVAATIFVIAWNTRSRLKEGFLIVTGAGSVFVALFSILHALSYKGMAVFPIPGANLATQLWIASRILLAAVLLAASLLTGRSVSFHRSAAAAGCGATALAAMIFTGLFPKCFIEGVGLTPFKVATEYAVALTLGIALWQVRRRRARFDADVAGTISSALFLQILVELAFTLYQDVYGVMNFSGHILKVAGDYLIYRALVVSSLQKPFDVLFRDLKQSKEKYRHLYKDAPVMLFSVNTVGTILSVSEFWLKSLGYQREEVLGKSIASVLAPGASPALVEDALNRFAEKGQLDQEEWQIIRRDGTVRDVIIAGIAESDEYEGDRYMCVFSDVTERKKAEVALRKSEEKFSKAFRSNPALVVISTIGEGRLVEANDVFCRVMGFIPGEVIGQTWEDLHLWNSPEERHSVMEKLRDGDPVVTEVLLRKKDGRPFTGYASFEALELQGVDCFIGTAIDVSQLKDAMQRIEMLNQALQERADELERANEDLDAFSLTLTHDLRGPLQGVTGFAELLKEELKSEPHTTYVAQVLMSARRMEDLVNTLLRFFRLSRATIHKSDVDIAHLAREIHATLQVTNPQRNVTFICPDTMPACGDPAILRVALENLVGNAWKYTGRHPQPKIEIGLSRVDGGDVFFISDNGVGFPQEKAAEVFEPLKRLHGKNEFEGNGIGLASVRKIIERHGGRIWAESSPGCGATFYFTLTAPEAPPPTIFATQ